jgi:hypothetical protein
MVAFSFASCAARERSTLFRQQVVGTLGATIHGGITLSPQGVLSVHFANDEGRTSATDVKGTVQITRVEVPSFAPIGEPSVHPVHYLAISTGTAATFEHALDPRWMPLNAGGMQDNWDQFVAKTTTVKVEVSYTYDNGFGDRMQGEPFCRVYFAHWNIKTKRGSSGGGGFIPCEDAVLGWELVNRQKQDEARGIYRD